MSCSLLRLAAGLALLQALPAPAAAGTYDLAIEPVTVLATGSPVEAMGINGSVPGPTLRLKEGEDVTLRVTNRLETPSSIHWHGLLIDPAMDGVPGLNGFAGIAPGETFIYRFRLRQAGTYWYHSHSGLQEQQGVYGALVVEPAGPDRVKADREHVIVLSDFTAERPETVLRNIKGESDYYNRRRRTVLDFFDDVGRDGLKAALKDRLDWGSMRMEPTDLSDVSGYVFLVNGQSPDQNWTGLFKPGERVRLRFINASAMSFYDVFIPGLKMAVVQADGRDVEPVLVDEFRFAVAETYDVIVTPTEDRAYSIVAQSIDRLGQARGTLAPREGMAGDLPPMRPRALLTMADMALAHGSSTDHAAMGHDMGTMDHAAMGHDMSGMDHAAMGHGSGTPAEARPLGWAAAGTPPGAKALSYADLRSAVPQKDLRPAGREIIVRLGGSMERYVWTLNGETMETARPIELVYGERIKLTFVNETMMAHPMHLHGMFVQLDNGQPGERLPDKHVVSVPPSQRYSVLVTADEAGEWAFHCHLLYHMASGMMTSATVAKLSAEARP